MEIIYLLIGLVIGAISTFVIINYFKQNKQIVDISNFDLGSDRSHAEQSSSAAIVGVDGSDY